MSLPSVVLLFLPPLPFLSQMYLTWKFQIVIMILIAVHILLPPPPPHLLLVIVVTPPPLSPYYICPHIFNTNLRTNFSTRGNCIALITDVVLEYLVFPLDCFALYLLCHSGAKIKLIVCSNYSLISSRFASL